MRKEYDIFAYLRSYNNEKLLVINNFYYKQVSFNLPDNLKLEGKSLVLISNYKDTENNIKELILRTYESVVFYIKLQ